jgi:hypothetical protein
MWRFPLFVLNREVGIATMLRLAGAPKLVDEADDTGVKMTIAICIKCGAEKFGAFSPCECGFTPTSKAEMAESMFLSDHNYTHSELRDIGNAIKSGEVITVDPLVIAEIAGSVDEEEEIDTDFSEILYAPLPERKPLRSHDRIPGESEEAKRGLEPKSPTL